jgi:UDP-N-acetylmuramoyl-tripeptide--D-alanyl-D-alanine ligase
MRSGVMPSTVVVGLGGPGGPPLVGVCFRRVPWGWDTETVQFTLSEVVKASGGRLVPAGAQTERSLTGTPSTIVAGAATDSREVRTGQLFVPVVAERDGHDFVAAAVRAGAAAYLTSKPAIPGVEAPAVEVADTMVALADLGSLARAHLRGPVVGVTGSVGKTSVKDLLAQVLSVRWLTTAAVRSFNNELGVPLTLANAADDTEATVVELGARGLGHIAELCRIARPTVGVVTTVGAAHLELFGSIEEVARGKGELVEALPANGFAVLNAADGLVSAMAARTAAQVVTFGAGGDVQAEDIELDEELRPRFRLVSPWGNARVSLAVRGAHMVGNALAAAAVGLALGLRADEVKTGLRAATISPWRMELLRTACGARVINDAYNANPLSMRAALEALASLPGGGRRVAVLGTMAELGIEGLEAHRRVAERAADLGVVVIAFGTDAYGATPVGDVDEALQRLGVLDADDAVLVKASRVVGLERLAQKLADRAD